MAVFLQRFGLTTPTLPRREGGRKSILGFWQKGVVAASAANRTNHVADKAHAVSPSSRTGPARWITGSSFFCLGPRSSGTRSSPTVGCRLGSQRRGRDEGPDHR